MLGTPAFAAGKYLQDSVVLTVSTDGTETKFWQATDTEHTAVSGDMTAGASASDAPTLTTDHWMEIPLGKIVGVDSVSWSRDSTQEDVKFACEKEPRSTHTANPIQITVNVFYDLNRQKGMDIWSRVNTRAYFEFRLWDPIAKMGDKGIVRKGYARVASTTEENPTGGGNITSTWTLTADGSGFVTEDYTLTMVDLGD